MIKLNENYNTLYNPENLSIISKANKKNAYKRLPQSFIAIIGTLYREL